MANHPRTLQITWLGHGTFLLTSPGGVRILIDPWLTDNPACPEAFKRVDDVDLILVTHGHSDHVGDLARAARASGAPVVAIVELGNWLRMKGLQDVRVMNKGGTQELMGIAITMVSADHSSGLVEDGRIVYLGEPAGYVLRLENGLVVYFAGDTGLFGDMRLIGELYRPVIAFLPIGDRFTMGPEAAARASAMLGVRQVVPMHYGTFPQLTGSVDRFKALVGPTGVEVLALVPGEPTT